jgi:hypothetical protein
MVLLAGVALLLSACSLGSQRGPQVGGAMGDGVELRVENGSAASLRVAARTAGTEISLGRVGPLETRRLRLPRALSGQVQLVAHPSVSRDFSLPHVSESFTLTSGHRVTWMLHESPGVSDVPRLSSIHVYLCQAGATC